MKEQIRTPNLVQSNKEIANPSEFKALIIRMLTEMGEYGHKIEEKVKSTKRKMYREPAVMGRKSGLTSMVWRIRKK